MIDIKFLRENPDVVKQNIKNKFQDHKLHLVDEVIDLDKKNREAKLNGDNLRAERKSLSAEIGNLMRNGKKDEAESIKSKVQEINSKLEEMDAMMYKIEGEDLFLIGTSEHSMIGRFKEQLIKKDELPICMTSYSPCFRKEIVLMD